MKKVLCLLFVVVFVFTLVTNVHAALGNASSEINIDSVITTDVVNTLQEMLGQVRTEPEGFGFNDVDFSKLSLGSEIVAYRTGYQQITDIKYYKILEDGRIIAIVTIYVDPKGNPHITVGADFASELQKYAQKHKEYALLFEGDDLYAISPNGKGHLHSFPGSSNRIVNREMQRKSTINYSASIPLISLSIDEISILSYGSKYLNVPIKLQGSDGNCWAASIASIGQYRTGKNYTARQVCDKAGIGYDEGANIYDASYWMSEIYGSKCSNTVYYSKPYVSRIRSDINLNKPMFVAFREITNDPYPAGHAVIFDGYAYTSTSNIIRYMDPNFSTYRTINLVASDFVIVYGSMVLEPFAFIGLN